MPFQGEEDQNPDPYFKRLMQQLIRNGHRALDINGKRIEIDPAYGPDPLAYMRNKRKRTRKKGKK